ncbi:uncharacterized protein K460DRAFT_289482, partial [Cucurbitaria berberidis CBS 394.84]
RAHIDDSAVQRTSAPLNKPSNNKYTRLPRNPFQFLPRSIPSMFLSPWQLQLLLYPVLPRACRCISKIHCIVEVL